LETEKRRALHDAFRVVVEDKVSLGVLPSRFKVHGLLVHGAAVRLTKGYRNKLRAYAHLMARDSIEESDFAKLRGHLEYAKYVLRVAQASGADSVPD
jgi:RNA-directed DNA polymerase